MIKACVFYCTNVPLYMYKCIGRNSILVRASLLKFLNVQQIKALRKTQ